MKEIYTKPMAEVEEFSTVEVLTTSGSGLTPGGNENHDDLD